LRTGLRATSITQTGGAVRIATAEGPVLAERAIVATGGWTAPLLGAPFDRLLRVEPQTLHWLASTPEFPAAAPMPAFIWLHGSGAESNFYGFPPLPGAGGLKLATERYGAAVDMNALVREVAPGAAAALHRDHVEGRLKGIAPRALRSSVCAYTVTPDFGFIIDAHPDMDRVMVVSACSGHGFKHSAGIGEALAGALAEGQSPVDLAPFSLARFI
jgi:sarcosine oxidase